MTVGVETLPTTYTGDGSTVSFPLGFTYSQTSDVVVLVAGARLTGGYAVLSGNVVFDVAPAAAAAIVFDRDTPVTQDADFPAAGPFPSTAFAKQLDKNARIATEHKRSLGDLYTRSLMAPLGESIVSLPPASMRMNQFLAFDSHGNPVMSFGTGTDAGLRNDLASGASGKGAGLAGLSLDATYPTGTVGDRLQRLIFATDAPFACKTDGTDSTAGMQALAAFVNDTSKCPNGAMVWMPAGTIKITSNVTFTNDVTFVGHGPNISYLLCSSNARLMLTGSRQGPFNTAFTLQGFAILTDNVHASSPMHVDYSATYTGDGALSQTLTMRDVLIAGQNTSCGFNIGLELVDCPWPRLENVVFRGDNARTSAYGIKYTGTDGSPTFRSVRAYFLQDAIYCEGQMEGYVFDDLEIVSVQRGVTAKDTTNGLQPRFVVRNSHINAEECCIKTVGIDLMHIDESNDLYGQVAAGTATTWTAVDVTPTLATGTSNTIVCSADIRPTVNADGAYAATKIGVRVRGADVSLEDYVLGGMYRGCTTGIQLGTNTNGVTIDADTLFRNCTTSVSDGGGNNIRLQKTKAGTTVGTTATGGLIAISFGSLIQFSGTPIVIAAGGDGGNETYTVVQSSVTAAGCNVLVANSSGPLASGQTRRVNWIVAGNAP